MCVFLIWMSEGFCELLVMGFRESRDLLSGLGWCRGLAF